MTDNNITILYHKSCIGANTLYKVVSKIKVIAPFEITDKKEVTAMGDPS